MKDEEWWKMAKRLSSEGRSKSIVQKLDEVKKLTLMLMVILGAVSLLGLWRLNNQMKMMCVSKVTPHKI